MHFKYDVFLMWKMLDETYQFCFVLNEASLKKKVIKSLLYTSAIQGDARNCPMWEHSEESKPRSKLCSAVCAPANHPDVEER